MDLIYILYRVFIYQERRFSALEESEVKLGSYALLIYLISIYFFLPCANCHRGQRTVDHNLHSNRASFGLITAPSELEGSFATHFREKTYTTGTRAGALHTLNEVKNYTLWVCVYI